MLANYTKIYSVLGPLESGSVARALSASPVEPASFVGAPFWHFWVAWDVLRRWCASSLVTEGNRSRKKEKEREIK